MTKQYLLLIGEILENKYFRLFILLAVLYFTFILRAHNYERVPTTSHLDEQLYAWSGLYFIETGLPVSWSELDYPKRTEVYEGKIDYKGNLPEAWVILHRPWLDQPPLFSLLVGWFAHINNAERTDFIPSSYIRIPTVIIAAFTSIMIFLVARFVSGFWIGILSMTIYGTVPLFVFASRSAMPENLIALIFIAIVYLLLKFINKPKDLYILPIPILIGIAGLSKPTGYFLLPFALCITFIGYRYLKDIKSAIISCAYLIIATVPFIVAFFAYGYLLDAEVFQRITSIQSSRPIGFGSLAWFFITPSLDTVVLRDSWFVFCLLAAAYFIFNTATTGTKVIKSFGGYSNLIVLAFVYWVIIVMVSGGENDLLAWYRFPSYPLLAIMGAWGLQFIVKKADFFVSFLAIGMLLGNRMLLQNAFRDNVQPMQYRVIFSTLMLPSLLGLIFEDLWFKRASKIIIIGVITAGVLLNVQYIYNAFEIACESKNCPMVPSTRLSTMHFPIISKYLILGTPDRH